MQQCTIETCVANIYEVLLEISVVGTQWTNEVKNNWI